MERIMNIRKENFLFWCPEEE